MTGWRINDDTAPSPRLAARAKIGAVVKLHHSEVDVRRL
jgi:hypothetical protein